MHAKVQSQTYCHSLSIVIYIFRFLKIRFDKETTIVAGLAPSYGLYSIAPLADCSHLVAQSPRNDASQQSRAAHGLEAALQRVQLPPNRKCHLSNRMADLGLVRPPQIFWPQTNADSRARGWQVGGLSIASPRGEETESQAECLARWLRRVQKRKRGPTSDGKQVCELPGCAVCL